jgi:hypothetical protein
MRHTPRPEDYAAAVEIARQAIRRELGRRVVVPPFLGRIALEKAARGEALAPDEARALAAQIAAKGAPQKRRRGRPKGSGHNRERSAIEAALGALEGSPLYPTRNAWNRHDMAGCDAVAEAMRAEGQQQGITYASVEKIYKLMIAARRRRKAPGRLVLRLREILGVAPAFSGLRSPFSDAIARAWNLEKVAAQIGGMTSYYQRALAIDPRALSSIRARIGGMYDPEADPNSDASTMP